MTSAKEICEAHKKEYGQLPKVVVSAPGRIHLFGEHSSYFFKDKTLSMAVNIPVYVAATPREDTGLRFFFVQLGERKKAELATLKLKKEDRWANSLKAVVFGFASLGFKITGMNFTVYAKNIPSEGFGITSAIKAATALAIKKAFKIQCPDVQVLQAIERANRQFLKTRNIIADNFTAFYAEPNSLVLTDYAKQTYEIIPFEFDEYKTLVVDAKVPRVLIWDEDSVLEPQHALLLGDLKDRKRGVTGGWVYNTNPTDVNEELSVVSEDMRRKLLYVIYEHGHILDALDGIKKGKFTKFARAVNTSQNLLRDNYPISCPEIDWILKRIGELEPNVQSIREPVNCGRIAGKGFGHFVYTFIRKSDVAAYSDKLSGYARIFGFEPATFEVKGARGAHTVRI